MEDKIDVVGVGAQGKAKSQRDNEGGLEKDFLWTRENPFKGIWEIPFQGLVLFIALHSKEEIKGPPLPSLLENTDRSPLF